jgi:hypothetical protein
LETNRKIISIFIVLSFALSLGFMAVALAQIDQTYDVTKTSPVGAVGPLNTVVLTATTSDNKVDSVKFTWYAPGTYGGTPAFESTDTDGSNGYTSSYTVDSLGQWRMIVTFYNSQDQVLWTDTSTVQVFFQLNVVPEFAVLGTAGALIAMLGSFMYMKKRKN